MKSFKCNAAPDVYLYVSIMSSTMELLRLASLFRGKISASVAWRYGVTRLQRPERVSARKCTVHSMYRQYSTPALHFHGKCLVVSTGSTRGEDATYHPTWLRHNCQCPSCIARSSGQKTINLAELTPSLTLDSAQLSGDRLELKWSSGHSGYIELDWLRKTLSAPVKREQDQSTPKVASELPVMSSTGLFENKETLWKWLYYLNEYGVCLLTDLEAKSGVVRKLAETMYNVQSTVYGETFEVMATKDSINVAYGTDHLNFHMDLGFYSSPPGLQLLHCVCFDDCVEGGESVMLDLFAVVEEMREKHPQHFETLTRVPATFIRIHYDRKEPVHMVCRAPHIQVDSQGKVVCMRWNTAIDGPLAVPQEDVQPYYEAYHCLVLMINTSKLQLSHRLRPGEAMTFNNRRVLHSRKGFTLNGGQRHLQGVYVDIDHFKSKYEVLCNQLGKTDVPIRQVFNGNST